VSQRQRFRGKRGREREGASERVSPRERERERWERERETEGKNERVSQRGRFRGNRKGGEGESERVSQRERFRGKKEKSEGEIQREEREGERQGKRGLRGGWFAAGGWRRPLSTLWGRERKSECVRERERGTGGE